MNIFKKPENENGTLSCVKQLKAESRGVSNAVEVFLQLEWQYWKIVHLSIY